MTNQAKLSRYRPYLSEAAIIELLKVISLQHNISPALEEARKALVSIQLKIGAGLINPAYVASAESLLTVEDKLGMTFNECPKPVIEDTPEQRRAFAHAKWLANPSSCSKDEIEMAHTWRYDNGVMTEVERLAYEEAMFKVEDHAIIFDLPGSEGSN